MLVCLRDLVLSLVDEHGVSPNTFYSIYDLIFEVMGVRSGAVFSSSVEAIDNRFFFKDIAQAKDVWKRINEVKDESSVQMVTWNDLCFNKAHIATIEIKKDKVNKVYIVEVTMNTGKVHEKKFSDKHECMDFTHKLGMASILF